MIEITINDQKILVPPGTTILEAALQNSIEIPRLCYHPELSVSGGCRMCQVEIEGWSEPVASCGIACQPGQVVRTHTQKLYERRRDIIDLFISDHPLDCVTCDKAGACSLQKYAYEFNLKETTLEKNISRTLYQDDNPFFIRDHQYCILCGRCVRICDEIIGVNAIDFVGRGFEAYIATPFDIEMKESSCVFCGSCVQVCPTAALMPVSRMNRGREWEMDRVKSICGYCGVGCQVEYARKDGKIIYAQSTPQAPVNGELLCTKGRYGWDYVDSDERLNSPMLRKDVAYDLGITTESWSVPEESPLKTRRPKIENSHVPVSWDVVYDYVAAKLSETVSAHGPDSVMGLSSARCTNEDNYLFQKFFRASIKTNNIDHCARL